MLDIMNETVLEREVELICMINSFEVRLNNWALYEVVTVSWQLKKQDSVALSSTEAEYMVASSATREAL